MSSLSEDQLVKGFAVVAFVFIVAVTMALAYSPRTNSPRRNTSSDDFLQRRSMGQSGGSAEDSEYSDEIDSDDSDD